MKLINENLVSYEDALMYATSPDELRLAYEGVGTGSSAMDRAL